MSDPMLTLGLAALGVLYPFAAFELVDAYRYRDHPTTDLRGEIRGWGAVLALWTLAVAVAAWHGGHL